MLKRNALALARRYATSNSPLTRPPPPESNVLPVTAHPPDPSATSVPQHPTGYVLATSNRPGVPPGPYPTSAWDVPFPPTDPPRRPGTHERSSTSPDVYAHPATTAEAKVPHNPNGVWRDGAGASSALRFREAPGKMAPGGGGGLGLMDKSGTVGGHEGSQSAPSPDDPRVAERWSKMGPKEAWKERP